MKTLEPTKGRIVNYRINGSAFPMLITDVAGLVVAGVVFGLNGVPATLKTSIHEYDDVWPDAESWSWPEFVSGAPVLTDMQSNENENDLIAGGINFGALLSLIPLDLLMSFAFTSLYLANRNNLEQFSQPNENENDLIAGGINFGALLSMIPLDQLMSFAFTSLYLANRNNLEQFSQRALDPKKLTGVVCGGLGIHRETSVAEIESKFADFANAFGGILLAIGDAKALMAAAPPVIDANS